MRTTIAFIILLLVSCGGTPDTISPEEVDDNRIELPQYSSPYGEYYLRIRNVESCADLDPYSFAKLGTQRDFFMDVVSDLSNFYKENPHYAERYDYLARFQFGSTVWDEIGIEANKKFRAAWPGAGFSIMYNLHGQFSENWGSFNFSFSMHIVDPYDLTLLCIDRWRGVASKITDVEVPNIR